MNKKNAPKASLPSEGHDMVARLKIFLDNLYQGEFSDQLDRAFEELNLVISNFTAARKYLLDKYLPALYTNGRASRQQLTFIAYNTLKYPVASLAHVVSEALIQIYAATEGSADEDVLSILLDIVIKYGLVDFVSIERGRNLRLEAAPQQSSGASFSLNIASIRLDIKLDLLQILLKKYVKLLVVDGTPSPQDLQSIVRRLNDVLSLLLNFANKSKLARRTSLRPFAFDQISYTPEQASRLFGSELKVSEYESMLFELYRIPLLPVIEADNLKFVKNKLTFRNEGEGSLPPATIRVRVSDTEFELGQLIQPVLSGVLHDLFVEEEAAFADFLLKQNPNLNINVVFSFKKFGHSYDLGIFAKPVGNWREQIPQVTMERAIPYEIPLDKLNDKEFERLCKWLVDDLPETRFNGVVKRFSDTVWSHYDGGGERGRDVIANEVGTGKKYVFQCKKVQKYQPNHIKKELTTFAGYVDKDPSIKPDVYVLFMSCAITDKTKATGDQLATDIGMEIEYWPKSTIDRFVRINENVNKRFGTLVQR
jgi:hypothetical protein